jgi:menaquinone reductase, multiheme cytochrome c subunit
VKKGTELMGRYHYVFPKWSNMLLPTALILGPIVPLYVVLVVAYGFSPWTTDVGYKPIQPIPYSHELHVGQLGIDCRYCHNTVEFSAKASVPPTQTCMNCHAQIHRESPNLVELWRSFEQGTPVMWTRVHDLPDFTYFDHSAHVARGVSCVECHGRVDRMVEVQTVAPLSMAWCLDCHRYPEGRVRDPNLVTQLGWSFQTDPVAQSRFANAEAYHAHWFKQNNLMPSQDCSACHR